MSNMENMDIIYLIKNIDRLSKEQIIERLESIQKEYVTLRVNRAVLQEGLYLLKAKIKKNDDIINDTENEDLIQF